MNLPIVLSKLLDFLGYTVAPFVLVLGVMILVHELGHFLAAKLIGVRVLIFKIGFGKYIYKTQRGHTEYGIGLFPIGGYVGLFGDPTEAPEGQDEPLKLEEIPESDRREALVSKTPAQKFLAFFAGPLMNIALSFLLAPIIFLMGEQVVPARAGTVEKDSPAAQAGIKPGDKILSINGKTTASFHEVAIAEALNPEKTMDYELERDGKTLTVAVTLREGKEEPIGESGIMPPVPTTVGAVMVKSPAEISGLKVGDKILAVDFQSVTVFQELQEIVNRSQGDPMIFRVAREGRDLDLVIIPLYREDAQRYLIGISPREDRTLVRYGVGASIVKGSELCVESVVQTYVVLWKLISGQLSAKVMSGPLGIGAITSQAAHSGLSALLALTVLIGINLGVLNLLPIPPLDGGHILVVFIESVIRREIKMKYKEAVFRAGMLLFLTLMVLVTLQDFFRYKTRMGEFFVEIWKGLGF